MQDKEVLYTNEFMDIVMVNPNYPFLLIKKPGVVIVPYDKEGNVYMLYRERINVGKFYELPRGFVESDEDYKVGALRELLEETGMKSGQAIKLGKIQTDTGLMTNNIEVIALEVENISNYTHYDDSDKTSNLVIGMTKEEISNKILSGDILCSLTLSALVKYLAYIDRV